MPALDIHTAILVYSNGEAANANPERRYVDWQRHVSGIEVDKPAAKEYTLQPGETLTIFSGSRSTAIDGTSAFALTLSTLSSSVYRLTNTGGTSPAFRTKRTFDPTGIVLTLVVNNNATLELTRGTGSFSGISVGDTLFIPGTTTGDAAGSFNPNNEGEWIVLATTSTKLTLRRPVGTAFNGSAEVVTPAAATELLIYSAAGVQVGDTLEISLGFSAVTQSAYVVSAVTDKWVEFTSVEDLPLESGILPTASGLVFYTDSKRFLRVECDQSAVLRLNGDTGNTVRTSPRVAGDVDSVGHFELWGTIWSLTIVNRSTTSSLVANVISAE